MRFLLTALAFAGLSACTTYRIHSLEHHGAMPVLKLETVRTTNSLFWVDVEHQFWICHDEGGAEGGDLVCHRSCGSGYDLDAYGLFGDIELIESRPR